MFLASMRVRRQLEDDERVARYASVVAGPTEFWTITVWRSRHDMQEFMRSGAHDEVMWSFSRWLRSFWLMRWRPGPIELGRWQGLTLAQPQREGEPGEASGSELLSRALEHLPRLKAATAGDGAARYESTPGALRRRREVGDAAGVVVSISTTPLRTPRALGALRRVRRAALRTEDAQRAAIGVGRAGEAYLLAIWRDRAAAARFLSSAVMGELVDRWGDQCWANAWRPENEFGHWDGLRLRRPRQGYAISVPRAALDAGNAFS